MTDGVRFILRRAQGPMSAIDVRDELANWGFDMSRYANDLSAIHTVLKRLNKAGEIRFVSRGAGSQVYEWMCDYAGEYDDGQATVFLVDEGEEVNDERRRRSELEDVVALLAMPLV